MRVSSKAVVGCVKDGEPGFAEEGGASRGGMRSIGERAELRRF